MFKRIIIRIQIVLSHAMRLLQPVAVVVAVAAAVAVAFVDVVVGQSIGETQSHK